MIYGVPHAAMIAALYVDPKGVYSKIDGVDCWGLPDRNARHYEGPGPVIAHPPCARWCRLAGLVEKKYGIKRGEDGGAFAHALAMVRKYGGVLEHPAYTDAWAAHELIPPERQGWSPADWIGGWGCQVEQAHYGHKARKATWLYVYGASPNSLPSLRWGRSQKPLAWCSWGDFDRYRNVSRLSKSESSATPREFATLLVNIAKLAHTAPDAPAAQKVELQRRVDPVAK